MPKGAVITGHISRILQQEYVLYAKKRYYLVGLTLDTSIAGDAQVRVLANLESLGPPYNFINSSRYLPAPSYGFIPFSDDPNKWGTWDDQRTLFNIPTPDRGESFLGIVNEFLRLPDHLKMYWRTLEPPQ